MLTNHTHRSHRQRRQTGFFLLVALLLMGSGLLACEGCKEKKQAPKLTLPFSDNFDRAQLGPQWWTARPGRWTISYNATTKQGRLCGEQARTNHVFLQGRLPDNVVIEFDAWGMHPDGDIKMEMFSDGRYNKTGYVLVQGGWVNRISIIDRLGEHNNKTRSSRRRVKGKPLVIKGKKYHWKITRYGKDIRWYIDGKLYLKYHDELPLKNPNHAYLAFGNWIARTCFDNLKIDRYEPKTAAKAATPRAAAPTPQPVRRAPTRAPAPEPNSRPAPAPGNGGLAAPRPGQPRRVLQPVRRPLMLKTVQPLHKPALIHRLKPGFRARRVRYFLPRRLPPKRR